MNVKQMTLKGSDNKAEFIIEWFLSEKRKATFVQSNDRNIYLMPYGKYKKDGSANPNVKFSGHYRSPAFVIRDFGLKIENILGGGFFEIEKDSIGCRYSGYHIGFQEILRTNEIEKAINDILFNEKRNKKLEEQIRKLEGNNVPTDMAEKIARISVL